jgi:PAS domain S-box-containing protein
MTLRGVEFSGLLETFPDGVYELDLNGRIVFVNARLCTLLGLERESLIGRPMWELRHLFTPHGVRGLVVAFAHARQGVTDIPPVIATMRSTVGEAHSVSVSLSLFRDAEGYPCGYLGTVRDASAQVNEQRRLQAAVHQKSELIQVGIHRLLNLMSLVSGFLDLAVMDIPADISDENRTYFDSARSYVVRMERMAKNMLELERLETRTNTPTALDLRELAETTFVQYRDEFRLKAQTARLELPSRPVMVKGIANDLSEATANLVSNAIKYTPNGGRVSLRVRTGADRAQLEVSDTGIGIPPEMQTRLFEPFYRARNALEAGISGNGLGLHIVKQMIERSGGMLIFHSSPGEGSLFGFSLPLIRTDDKPG